MKKFFFIALAAIALASCHTTPVEPVEPDNDRDSDSIETPTLTPVMVSFEDARLDSNGVLFNTPYTTGNLTFSNLYNAEWGSWSGFAISNNTDMTVGTWENQYSVYSLTAREGDNFAVTFFAENVDTPTVTCAVDMQPEEISVCNTTYGYISMRDGSAYNKQFAEGDYFKMTFVGVDAEGQETGRVDFYLADFAGGRSTIVDSWTPVDLSPLGVCRSIRVIMDSSDRGDYGMNNPTYAALDYFKYSY